MKCLFFTDIIKFIAGTIILFATFPFDEWQRIDDYNPNYDNGADAFYGGYLAQGILKVIFYLMVPLFAYLTYYGKK